MIRYPLPIIALLLLLCASAWGAPAGFQYRQSHLIHGSPDGTLFHYPKTLLVVRANPVEWAPSTEYLAGQWIIPTAPNGLVYEAQSRFTSGSTEPFWDTTEDGLTNDGVTTGAWKCRGDIAFVGTKVNEDFSDLRFTADDGETLIPHWIERSVPHHRITRLSKSIYSSYQRDGVLLAACADGKIYTYDIGTDTWSNALLTFSATTEVYGAFIDSNGNYYISSPWENTPEKEAGLWRSIDQGASWTRVITLTEGTTGVNRPTSIWGMDEAPDGTLYAGGHGFQNVADARTLYRSIDGGETWTGVEITGARHIHGVAVDRYNQTNGEYHVYLTVGDLGHTTNWGIHVSTDGGATFANIQPVIQAIGIVITKDGKFFSGDMGAGRVWKFTDSPITTTSRERISYDSQLGISGFFLKANESDDQIMYAGWNRLTQRHAYVNVSPDGGQSWHRVLTLPTTSEEDGTKFLSNVADGSAFLHLRDGGETLSGAKLTRDSEYAIVHVSVPNIPTEDTATIYMYYGNVLVNDSSSPEDVCLMYEDFSETFLDTVKWEEVRYDNHAGTYYTISDGKIRWDVDTGSLDSPAGYFIKSFSSWNKPVRTIFEINDYNMDNTNAPEVFIGFVANEDAITKYPDGASIRMRGASAIGLRQPVLRTAQDGIESTPSSVFSPRMEVRGASTTVARASDGHTTTTTTNVPDEPLHAGIGVHRGADSGPCWISVDWIGVLQTTAKEPLNGAWGEEEVTCTLLPAPSWTSYPSSTSSTGSFTISWTSVSGATSYVVERSTNSSFSPTEPFYPGSETSINQTGLGSGTYYYRVRAVNCGLSEWENGSEVTVCIPPAAPASITYPTSSSTGSFTVSWAQVSDATSYVVERSTNSSFSPTSQVYSGSSTSYSQTGLGSGTYYYRVRAVNCGLSEWENGSGVTVTRSSGGGCTLGPKDSPGLEWLLLTLLGMGLCWRRIDKEKR
jgi:photosystem II stability/assembly factor-like uncharacterized protein